MCTLKYTNKLLKQQSNTNQYSNNHIQWIPNDDCLIITNFAPYRRPQRCHSCKSPINNLTRIIQFAFPFELWNYIKYFHKLFYRIASLAAPGHLLYSQHAQSLSYFTFELAQFYWFRWCSLSPEHKMTRSGSTLRGDPWPSKKRFLLYVLEKNVLNKTWRTRFETMILFMKIFCRRQKIFVHERKRVAEKI